MRGKDYRQSSVNNGCVEQIQPRHQAAPGEMFWRETMVYSKRLISKPGFAQSRCPCLNNSTWKAYSVSIRKRSELFMTDTSLMYTGSYVFAWVMNTSRKILPVMFLCVCSKPAVPVIVLRQI